QLPPHVVTDTCDIQESFVNEGCIIEGTVRRSIISQDVHVKVGAEVDECVVMEGTVIGAGAKIRRAIITPDLKVPDNFELQKEDGEITLMTRKTIADWEGRANHAISSGN